ncbi:MAG: FAD:protein FMN transferase [Gammaproteobacteria bacterium]
MGTRVQIELWHDDADDAARLIRAGMAEFDRIDAAMSTYRDDSEITRINDAAASGPVEVGAELFELIERALDLSELTAGSFDITYDSVGQLYDYRSNSRPGEDAIRQSLAKIDYRLVELDADASTIQFAAPGVRINLGGIAKGYACESVIALLRERGVTNALVSAGGDTRLLGDRGNGPWVVGIRDPDDKNGVVTRLALDDEAVSTSGDYERFFDEDGVRYHHILNPSTGHSAGELRSVSVIGPDATMTDGLSTSVFVLGPTEGLALIEQLQDYEAILIDTQHRVRFSTGFDAR